MNLNDELGWLLIATMGRQDDGAPTVSVVQCLAIWDKVEALISAVRTYCPSLANEAELAKPIKNALDDYDLACKRLREQTGKESQP